MRGRRALLTSLAVALLVIGVVAVSLFRNGGTSTPPTPTAALAPSSPPVTPAPTATIPATSAITPTETSIIAPSPTVAPTATVAVIRPTLPAPTPTPPAATPTGNLTQDVRAARARDLPPTSSVTLLVLGGEVHLDDARDDYAASTIKLPLYLTLAHRINTGEAGVTWETPITIRQENVVGGTGVLQTMVGSTQSVREIARLMIVESDNIGANLLLGRLGGGQDTSREHIRAGAAVVTAYLAALGVDGMTVRHGLQDAQAFATGMLNTTTTAALARLLQITERDRATLDGATDVLALLSERGTHNPWHPSDAVACGLTVERIGGIYPATPDRDGVRHDALIVTTPGNAAFYILAVSVPTTPTLERTVEAQIARFEGDVHLVLTGWWAQCVDSTTRQT